MDIRAAVDEYLTCKQNAITAKTYRWYEQFLRWWCDWCDRQNLTDLSQITTAHVQQFVASNPKDSSNTRHHRAQVVKGFLNWCAQDDEMGVRKKVVERIEMPKVVQEEVQPLTDKEMKAVFKAAERVKYPIRATAIVKTFLETGIRLSELGYDGARPQEETGLRMENLFFGRDDSYIRVMGKGRQSRTVGIESDTVLALKRYLNRERPRVNSEYVFLSDNGDPLSIRMIEDIITEIGELAGIDGLHPHKFRHTYAVNQLLSGTDSKILRILMGHKSVQAQEKYLRTVDSIKARVMSISVVNQVLGIRKRR
jgi:site-specific recombinase XerD